jgi:putative transposase
MTVTKTARQKIRNHTRYFHLTLERYRAALEMINWIVLGEWESLKGLPSKMQVNQVEHLIHTTKDNIARYPDFDKTFHKFPSYFRRMVIAQALGHVSSHQTRHAKWASNKKGRPPKFQARCNRFPVFYQGGVSQWINNSKLKLKLYNGSDWIWFAVPVEPVRNFAGRFPAEEGWERQNPMLVSKARRWYLHVPYEKKVQLEAKDYSRPILSVDLGLNTTATCSVLRSDGTVLHRKFVDYAREKDRLDALLGRISSKAAQTVVIPAGSGFNANLWRRVNDLTDEIAHQCSAKLVRIAREHDCQTIVFEHLGHLRVPRGFWGARKLRKKVHYWLQGRIQKFTRYKAHREGIQFSKVLARGTSQFAFDGSGEVKRKGNRQEAVFPGGKRYNADLSASYNIAARYWLREFFPKSLGRNIQVDSMGQSPIGPARHRQTLESLISSIWKLSSRASSGAKLYPFQSCSFTGKPPLRAVA